MGEKQTIWNPGWVVNWDCEEYEESNRKYRHLYDATIWTGDLKYSLCGLEIRINQPKGKPDCPTCRKILESTRGTGMYEYEGIIY